MTSVDRPQGEHARALERLDAASAERDRLRGHRHATDDEGAKLVADASLYAANEEVAARERWLQWVGEDGT